MITVVHYGLGNIASVANMIRKVGGMAKISNNRDEILSASKIILPGVGSFDHGIEQLHALDLFSVVLGKAAEGTPLLAICLGMQLLANRSDEGHLNGLGLINAEFKRFQFDSHSPYRVPHVGWNHVRVEKENPLIPKDCSEQRFYFTHSYHAVCKDQTDVLTTTEYGYPFTSAYSRKNVFGVQFHPEKSHSFGMTLIKRFLEL
jgi:glutamine amidotransferase